MAGISDSAYLGGAGIGAASSTVMGFINNMWADARARRDRQANYYYGELAAKNADRRTRALYNDFYSPEALLRQYEQAGLSPSMMFGGTPGQGGMSGAKGTGAMGPTTPFMPISMVDAAQAEALLADARLKKANADTIEGKNEQGMATIAKTWAEAGHAEASKALETANAAGVILDNYVKENTREANVYTILQHADEAAYTAERAYQEARKAKIEANYSEETYDTMVQTAKQNLEAITQSIVESKSNVELNDQQKQYLRNEVLVSFDTVAQKWKDLDIKEKQQTSYSDWIDAQIPFIEKQLDIKLKELGIENRRVWVQCFTESLKAVAIGAATVSQFGKGGNQSVPMEKIGKPVVHSKNNSTVPVYKTNTIWEY